MSLVTKRGDDGNTDLWFADRVPKYHPQVEAYGVVYEAQAALGLARALAPGWLKPEILKIQKDLFTASSELATLRGKAPGLKERVGPGLVAWAEAEIARYEGLIKLTDWTISGESAGGAALDLGLTILRRAERWAVRLRDEGFVENPDLLVYLNRLSDLLFLMARAVDRGLEAPAQGW
ncbi:MAG: cob(I)yrinic acid a,c-diamide adenosyltransferase [Nitrospinota bacterium]